jgi:hypothetical protein
VARKPLVACPATGVLAAMTKISEIQPSQAFNSIKEAWQKGRAVVPLIGAGLSTEAGIPTTSGLLPYLAKVKHLLDNPLGQADRPGEARANQSVTTTMSNQLHEYRERLIKDGWPGAHQVNADLRELWPRIEQQINKEDKKSEKDKKPTSFSEWLSSIRSIVLLGEFQKAQPDLKEKAKEFSTLLTGNWRGLLRRVSDGDPVLIDSFFSKLVRGRRPATGHQFLAFLCQLMGWRLVLTTNFDNLIETAFRDQGLDPTVYELPEHGPIPDPRLVMEHFSLLKLHGGGFGLRVGESLDAPMDQANIGYFTEYFREDALLVVIGYGGADRRVMSLIEEIVKEQSVKRTTPDGPKLLWVYRNELPASLERAADFATAANVVTAVRYQDGSLFLQELYGRLTTCQFVLLSCSAPDPTKYPGPDIGRTR